MGHSICTLSQDNLEQSGVFDNFIIYLLSSFPQYLNKESSCLSRFRMSNSYPCAAGQISFSVSINSSRFGVLFYIELFSHEIYSVYRCQRLFFLIAAILSFDRNIFTRYQWTLIFFIKNNLRKKVTEKSFLSSRIDCAHDEKYSESLETGQHNFQKRCKENLLPPKSNCVQSRTATMCVSLKGEEAIVTVDFNQSNFT